MPRISVKQLERILKDDVFGECTPLLVRDLAHDLNEARERLRAVDEFVHAVRVVQAAMDESPFWRRIHEASLATVFIDAQHDFVPRSALPVKGSNPLTDNYSNLRIAQENDKPSFTQREAKKTLDKLWPPHAAKGPKKKGKKK